MRYTVQSQNIGLLPLDFYIQPLQLSALKALNEVTHELSEYFKK